MVPPSPHKRWELVRWVSPILTWTMTTFSHYTQAHDETKGVMVSFKRQSLLMVATHLLHHVPYMSWWVTLRASAGRKACLATFSWWETLNVWVLAYSLPVMPKYSGTHIMITFLPWMTAEVRDWCTSWTRGQTVQGVQILERAKGVSQDLKLSCVAVKVSSSVPFRTVSSIVCVVSVLGPMDYVLFSF